MEGLPGVWLPRNAPPPDIGDSVPYRTSCATATDDTHGTVYVHGGYDSLTRGCVGGTCRFTVKSNTWDVVGTRGGFVPRPRALHAMCYHESESERCLFLWGGATDGGVALWDFYEMVLSVMEWCPILPLGPTPSAMTGHTLTSSPEDGNLYLMGGIYFPMGMVRRGRPVVVQGPAMWRWNVRERVWSSMEFKKTGGQTSPGPRTGHAVAASRGSLFLFGGMCDASMAYRNDLWEFSVGVGCWAAVLCGGEVPTPRAFTSAVMCPGGLLVVFGGVSGPRRTPEKTMAVFSVGRRDWVWRCASQLVVGGSSRKALWRAPPCGVVAGGKLVGVMCMTATESLSVECDVPVVSRYVPHPAAEESRASLPPSEDSGKRRRETSEHGEEEEGDNFMSSLL